MNWYKINQERKIRLWLDDVRPMPPGFDTTAKTAPEAIEYLKTGQVEAISLDHDLGEPENGTGYDVASWIEQAAFNNQIPRLEMAVHSANPIGRQRMIQALQNAQRYWEQNELV